MKKIWIAALALLMLTGSQLFATVPGPLHSETVGGEKMEFNFRSNKDKPWFGEPKSGKAVDFSQALNIDMSGKKIAVSSTTVNQAMLKRLAHHIDAEYDADNNDDFDVNITVEAYAALIDNIWVKNANIVDNTGMKNATNVNITPGMSASAAAGANSIAAATIVLQLFEKQTQMIYKISIVEKNNTTQSFYTQVGGVQDMHGYFLGRALKFEFNR